MNSIFTMKLSKESRAKKPNNKKTFVDLAGSRTSEQLEVLKDIHRKGVCPFCLQNLKDYHKEPILISGKYWIATKNQWPYKNTKHHFIFIHKTHIESVDELKPKEADELISISQKLNKKFKIKSGALCMRFGRLGKNGSSVSHLHAHLISAKDNLAENEHVRFKVG